MTVAACSVARTNAQGPAALGRRSWWYACVARGKIKPTNAKRPAWGECTSSGTLLRDRIQRGRRGGTLCASGKLSTKELPSTARERGPELEFGLADLARVIGEDIDVVEELMSFSMPQSRFDPVRAMRARQISGARQYAIDAPADEVGDILRCRSFFIVCRSQHKHASDRDFTFLSGTQTKLETPST